MQIYKDYADLESFIVSRNIKRILLVAGKSMDRLRIADFVKELESKGETSFVRFSSFTPNPKYEEVLEGVKAYRDNSCDAVLAIGGGSAMDVAKCIKLYAYKDGDGEDGSFLTSENSANDIPFMAMPTTAGTGSEVTRFAVIYYKGEKQSVAHDSLIPDLVLLDGTVLVNLPLYQKKATMLDALCHAIESAWSVKSCEESREHSKKAITAIMDNYRVYLGAKATTYDKMLMASLEAGRAINITQTTAGHAMCYKITTKYGFAHGHAAALCVGVLWRWMLEVVDKQRESGAECGLPESEMSSVACASRVEMTKEDLDNVRMKFDFLAECFGAHTPAEALHIYEDMLKELEMDLPDIKEEDLDILVHAVNIERLKNNPIALGEDDIRRLYQELKA